MCKSILFYILLICILIISLSFVLNRIHILNNLLILEFLRILIYGLINLFFFNLYINNYYSMYFLCLLVCERSLGLSILIIVTYYYRNDYLKRFILLGC